MESTTQRKTEGSTETVKQLQEDLYFYRTFSQGQLEEYFKLLHHFSRLDEHNEKLFNKIEDLSSQGRALKSKQDQLKSELYEKNQQLIDKEEEVHSLKICLQLRSEDTDKTFQKRSDQSGELLHAVSPQADTHNPELRDDSLSVLGLKEEEYHNVKKEKEERKGMATTIRIKLERSKTDLERSMADLESMMVSKLEEGAAPECEYDQKLSQLTSDVCSLEKDNKELLTKRKDLSCQVRALESKQEQLDNELQEKEQQLRAKEEEVQSLEDCLQSQSEDSERGMLQKADQICASLRGWEEMVERHHEHMVKCEINPHNFQSEIEILTRVLYLKGDMCGNLEKKLQEKNDEVTSIRAHLERLTSAVSSLGEDNEKLMKEKEDLNNQVRALESKQHQLNVELHEKNQQLRDKEEEVQALESTLESQREETETILQKRADQIGELLHALKDKVEKHHGYMVDRVNDTENLGSEVDALTSALELKEAECDNLKKELLERCDEITNIKTHLESSKVELERAIDDLENMMISKLEEATEEKLILQSEYDKKLSQVTSIISSLKEDNEILLQEKEDLHRQIRALESRQDELNSELENGLLKYKDEEVHAFEDSLQSQSKDSQVIMLQEDGKEDFRNQVIVPQFKQELYSELHEKEQYMKDEKDEDEESHALEDSLWSQSEETEGKLNDLLYAVGDHGTKHHVGNCVNNNHDLESAC